MTTEAALELAVLNDAIHCAGCESRIEGVLGRVRGVREVRADHRTQRVRLRVDTQATSARELLDRLARIGFEAREER